MTLGRLSVVITNYNYAHYVGQAIESALAVDWHDVEVIVVDDGSQDLSRSIIERYIPDIEAVFIENSTQRVAAQVGYERCSGEIVIFLDSDDILPRNTATSIDSRWNPNASKYQFEMRRIDKNGIYFGNTFPNISQGVHSNCLKQWFLSSSSYPTPPGSANAYPRSFLDRVFPIPATVGDFADSACLSLAPILGEIIVVPEVVVGYRRHGENDSNVATDPAKFNREISRAVARWTYAIAKGFSVKESEVDVRPLRRSRELLQFRAASFGLCTSGSSLMGDSRSRVVSDSIRSIFQADWDSLPKRLLVSLWCASVAVGPRSVANALVKRRYAR